MKYLKQTSQHTLFDLTKKDVGWHWGESEQASFNKLKELITSAPILVFPNDSLPYHIEANSSDAATGAVLSQQTSPENGGKWHPIAFFSKSLSPVEWNYKIHDKEMLAIIRALEEWRTSLKAPRVSLKSGQTTKTSNTSAHLRS